MATFVGLDVSLKETSVCVLDQDGTRVFEGKVESAPAAIANVIQKRAPDVMLLTKDNWERVTRARNAHFFALVQKRNQRGGDQHDETSHKGHRA